VGAIDVFTRLLLDDDEFKKKVEGANDRLESLNKTAGNIDKAGNALTKGLTLPIVALGGVAVAAATTFESAFLAVQQNVRGTDEELEDLRGTILGLAEDGKGSSRDLSELASSLGELGVTAAQLPAFLATTQDFAAATGQDLLTAGVALQDFLKRTGQAPEAAAGLANAIVDLGNRFNVSEAAILSFADSMAPTARALGIGSDALLTFGASFLKAGGDAEQGKAISNVFSALVEASGKATGKVIDNTAKIASEGGRLADLEDALAVARQRYEELGEGASEASRMAAEARIESLGRDIEDVAASLVKLNAENGQLVKEDGLATFARVAGVSVDEFRTMLQTDAMGAMQLFLGGLQAMDAAGGDTIGILDSLGLAGGRTRDAILTASQAMTGLPDAIGGTAAAFGETNALMEDSAKQAATSAQRMEDLKDKADGAAITLGAALLPVLVDLLDAGMPILDMVKDLAHWFGSLDEGPQKTIIGIAVALAAIGPILKLIAVATRIWAIAQWVLNVAMAANPIGLIILGVAALIAIVWLLVANWDQVASFLKDVWGGIAGFFSDLWEGIKGAFQAGVDWVMDKILPFVALPLLVIKHWDEVVAALAGVWDSIKAGAKAGWEGIVSFFSEFLPGLVLKFLGWGQDIVQGLWDGFTQKWNHFTDWVADQWDSFVEGFKDFFEIGSPSRLFHDYGSWIVEGFQDGLEELDVAAAVQPFADFGNQATEAGLPSQAFQDLQDALASWTPGGAAPTMRQPIPSAAPTGGDTFVFNPVFHGQAPPDLEARLRDLFDDYTKGLRLRRARE
jgi:Phage-related minor tail protein/TMP repeat